MTIETNTHLEKKFLNASKVNKNSIYISGQITNLDLEIAKAKFEQAESLLSGKGYSFRKR
jgi:hypothetical protein